MFKSYRVTYRTDSRRIAIHIEGAQTAIQAAVWAADRISIGAFIPRESLHLVSIEDAQ